MLKESRGLGLTIKRRPGEVLLLDLPSQRGGERIQILVSDVDRNHVSLTIKCARDINIKKGELEGIVYAYHAPE